MKGLVRSFPGSHEIQNPSTGPGGPMTDETLVNRGYARADYPGLYPSNEGNPHSSITEEEGIAGTRMRRECLKNRPD